MKSVTQALIWEFLHQHLWMVLLLVAIANTIPILCISTLKGYGVDLDMPELAILPTALIPLVVFLVGFAIAIGQGPAARHYLKPLSNTQLTLTFFFPGLVGTGAVVGLSIWSWNLLFGLHWPVVVPAIYAVIFWAALNPSLRVAVKTPWRIVESIFAILILSGWFFGAFRGLGNRGSLSWAQFSFVDMGVGIGVVLFSYWLCVRRIADDRCGKVESRSIALVRRWLDHWDALRGVSKKAFSSRTSAQTWLNWQTLGLPYVGGIGVVLVMLILLFVGMLFFDNRDINQCINEMQRVISSMFLLQIIFAGFWGLLAPQLRLAATTSQQLEEHSEINRGNSGSIDSFRACMPISDREFAQSILRVIAICVVVLSALFGLAWCVGWILSLATKTPLVLTDQQVEALPWIVLGGFVGTWAAMTCGIAVSFLVGQDKSKMFAGVIGLVAAQILAGLFLWPTTIVIAAVVAMLMIATLTYSAKKYGAKSIATSCAGAVGLIAIALALRPRLEEQVLSGVLVVIIAALAVIPIRGLEFAVAKSRRH